MRRFCAGPDASIAAKGGLARGHEAKAQTLNELGLPKNTQKVTTAEGNAISDALISLPV